MKEGFYEQIITQSLQKLLSALKDEVQQRAPFIKVFYLNNQFEI
jgi:hypothetical protein